jgi:class 3 adenylate cyclase
MRLPSGEMVLSRALPDKSPYAPETTPRKRKLAAILHADVVGFSRLMGEDEAGTHRALGELRHAVDPLIATYGGRIVGTAGDSLLADFSSVVDAVNCAVEMQRASRAINDPIPRERRLELRIGVNLGDVIIDGDDIFGMASMSPHVSRRLPSPVPSASRTPFMSR